MKKTYIETGEHIKMRRAVIKANRDFVLAKVKAEKEHAKKIKQADNEPQES